MGNTAQIKQYLVKKSGRSATLIQPGAKELKQSIKRIEALMDAAPVSICSTDLKGKFTYVNKGFEEVSGCSREEVVGKNGFKLGIFSNETVKLLEKQMKDRLMGRPPRALEAQFKCKDGHWIWVAIEVQLIWERGIPAGFQIILRDITEQKRAEEALQESNARFRDIVENALEWIWEVDANGKYTYVSPVVEKILGYKPEEVVKKHFYDLFHPDDREKLKGAAFEVFAKKQPFHRFLNRNVHKNGKTVWLMTSGVPILDEEGNLLGYRGADVDITETKRAEEALLESEERFRSTVENSHDGIMILDDAYLFTYVNDELCRISGYPRKEIIGQDFRKFIDEESRQLVADRYIRRQRGEEIPSRYEFNIVRKDGEKRRVEISSSVIKDSAGKARTVAQILDITERKQIEEAFQAEKNKLQSVVDAIEYGLTIHDMDYNIIYQNESLRIIFGDHVGEKCYRVYEGQDKICDGCPVEKAFRDGKSHTSERRVVIPSGEVTFWENTANPIRDATGRIVSCLEVARNITERKQAEEALRGSQEKLRKMFESVTDGISVIDLHGVITEVNQRTVEMHGFNSKDELLGKSAFELVTPRDRERVTSKIRQAIKRGAMRDVEYTLLRADGTEFPGELSTSVLKDASGNVVGHITIARDVTERKQAEEALREAHEQLIRSEKLAAIGQLASGVGHELRNPLGAIKNAIFYVRRRIAKSDLSATEPKVLEFLDIMDREVNSANKVISDLLGFSRVAKPTVSPVNIGSIIEDALKHVPIPENVKLTRDIDSSLPMVMVDADQIRQVFVNIILNAVEAMPEGGRLEIRARSTTQFVEVEFIDSGGGIPQSIIDKIFDPLFTTKAKGIGLGLAMCRSILERHGGNIQVRSEEGKGTAFTASLPTQVV